MAYSPREIAISGGGNILTSGTINFADSNGVSFGLDTDGIMTASVAGGVGGTYSFDNSNGVTFGVSDGTVTASVYTGYLTTAALSQDSSKYAGTNGAITGGSITVNTSGVSVNLPAYLTTAMLSNASLDNLADVVISSPSVDDAIKWNGAQWINGHIGAVGAGAGVVYFFDTTASGISTYETIATSPDSAVEADKSIIVNNQTLDFEEYSTAAALGRTTIDAGVWKFNIYTYASPSAGTSTLLFDVYKRTAGGSETLLFTAETEDINLASVGLLTVTSVQQAFALDSTDYLVMKVRAKTTATEDVTIHFVHSGVDNYSHVQTPLITLHNDLAGLQGGQAGEYFHFNSANYGFRNTTATSVYQLLANSTLSAGVGFTTTTIAGAVVAGTHDTAGLKLAIPAYLTTAQAPGAYLTTARASNDAIGLNTALTANGVAWTVNSSGLSLNIPAFLTTAAQSNHSHGNPTLALTNLTGTTASASNGFTLSLSAAAPGAGGGFAAQGSGAYTQDTGTIQWANSNGITFGLSTNIMTASHNGLTTAAQSDHSHGNPTLALTNLSGTTASASNGFTLSLAAAAPGGGAAVTVSASNGSFTVGQLNFSDANNVTFGTSAGSIITASVAAGGGGGGYSINHLENLPRVSISNLTNMTATGMTQRPIFIPFVVGGSLTHNIMNIEVSRATSGSNAFTMQAAIYTMANTTRLSRLASLQNVFSNTATASISGIRQLQLSGWEAAGTALTPGQYFMMLYASAAATASMNYSYRGGITAGPPVGLILAGTNLVQTATSYLSAAAGWVPFMGRYTTTTASPPESVHRTQIQNWTSGHNIYFYLGRT